MTATLSVQAMPGRIVLVRTTGDGEDHILLGVKEAKRLVRLMQSAVTVAETERVQ